MAPAINWGASDDTSADAPGIAWQVPVEAASGSAFAGPWRMNESRFHYVDDPGVAIHDDGSVGVVWVDNRAQNVYFQRFDPQSNPVSGAPVDVSRTPGVFSWLPKIAASGDGETVYVLWQEIVFSGSTHGGEALFSRSTDAGRTFSAPRNLSESRAGDGKGRLTAEYWHNGSLDIARGPGGAVYAAWTEYEGALWFRRSPDRGRHFEAPIRVAGDNEAPARGPDFGIGPDGTLYLAWTVGEDPAADIRLAVSEDGGRTFSEPRRLFSGEGHSDAPQVAVDAQGAVHLVYAESPSGMFGRYHVRYARLEPGARRPRSSRRISAAGAGQPRRAHFPSVAVRGRDAVIVVWERFAPGEPHPRGLGFVASMDGGRSFAAPSIVPGTDDPERGFNGGLQGLLMRKVAAGEAGSIAVVNSRFKSGESSRIRLIRGRLMDR